jgi:hypothetical protein
VQDRNSNEFRLCTKDESEIQKNIARVQEDLSEIKTNQRFVPDKPENQKNIGPARKKSWKFK